MDIWERLQRWIHDGFCTDPSPRRQYRQDWFGTRSDDRDSERPAGNLLLDAVRQYGLDPAHDRRQIIEHFILNAEMVDENALVNGEAALWNQESFWSAVALAKAALSLIDAQAGNIDSSAKQEVLDFEFWASATWALGALFSVNESESVAEELKTLESSGPCERNECGLLDCFMGDIVQLLAGLKEELHEPLLKTAIQLDAGLRWLTNRLDDVALKSSHGVVAFASKDASRPAGKLARLTVSRYKPAWVSLALQRSVMVSNPIFQGMLVQDGSWNDAFDVAARWATSECSSPDVFLYSLRFLFRDPSGIRNEFTRPNMIEGPSASLAAGVLARAILNDEQVDSRCCYIGAIQQHSEKFILAKVDGVGSKSKATSREQLGGSIILGPLTPHAEHQLETWGIWNEESNLEPVSSPEMAYDIATSRTETVRRYIESELRFISRKVAAFSHPRVKSTLCQSISSDESDAIFGCLDALTLPQTVERVIEPKSRFSSRQGVAGKEQKNIDDLIDEFLEQAQDESDGENRCLKILAPPGTGKTWASLRIHNSLMKDYWSGISRGKFHNLKLIFPVWVSFSELQRELSDGYEQVSLVETLSRIAFQRIPLRSDVEANTRLLLQLTKLIHDHFTKQSLMLIVDAWDERDRRSQADLRSWFDDLFAAGNYCVMFSRAENDKLEHMDPFVSLHPEGRPWVITSENTLPFSWFAKRWFGEDCSKYHADIDQIMTERDLVELTRVPQLASIVCWILFHGGFPGGPPTGRAQIIELALKVTLKMNALAAGSNSLRGIDGAEWQLFRDAVENGCAIELLAELAFNTYRGQSWEIDAQSLQHELRKPEYFDLLDSCNLLLAGRETHRPIQSLARILANSGVFMAVTPPRYEVIHRSIAEFLVARRMAQKTPVPEVKSYELAEAFSIEVGLFEPRWQQVFSYYVELLHDASNLLELVFVLHERLCNAEPRLGYAPDWELLELVLLRAERFTVSSRRKPYLHRRLLHDLTDAGYYVDPRNWNNGTSFSDNCYAISRNILANCLERSNWKQEAQRVRFPHSDEDSPILCSTLLLEYELGRISESDFRERFEAAIAYFHPVDLSFFTRALALYAEIVQREGQDGLVFEVIHNDAEVCLAEAIKKLDTNVAFHIRAAKELLIQQLQWLDNDIQYLMSQDANPNVALAEDQLIQDWISSFIYWLDFLREALWKENLIEGSTKLWEWVDSLLSCFYLELHLEHGDEDDSPISWHIESLDDLGKLLARLLREIPSRDPGIRRAILALVRDIEKSNILVSETLINAVRNEERVFASQDAPASLATPMGSTLDRRRAEGDQSVSRMLDALDDQFLVSIEALLAASLLVDNSCWACVNIEDWPWATSNANASCLEHFVKSELSTEDVAITQFLSVCSMDPNEPTVISKPEGLLAIALTHRLRSQEAQGLNLSVSQQIRFALAISRVTCWAGQRGLAKSYTEHNEERVSPITRCKSRSSPLEEAEVLFEFGDLRFCYDWSVAWLDDTALSVFSDEPMGAGCHVRRIDIEPELTLTLAGMPEISQLTDQLIELSKKVRAKHNVSPFRVGQ